MSSSCIDLNFSKIYPNSPAWKIVYEALKAEPDEGRLVALITDKLDEDELLSICHDHGLLLIVNQGLAKVRRTLFSETGEEKWRSAVATYTLLSLTMHRELQRLTPQFTVSGLDVVPFKGPVLSQRIYGDPALRMFTDLDLLVSTGQAQATVDLLIKNGYQPLFKVEELHKWTISGSKVNHCALAHPTGRWLIEVHWQLIASWRQFTPQNKIPEDMSLIGTGDAVETLLYLCIHGATHWWIQLKWVVDVDRFVRSSQNLDWDILFARAKDRGCERVLCLALYLARQVCDLELPEKVGLKILKDAKVATLACRVSRYWPPPMNFHPSLPWKLSYLLACRERFSDKIGMLIDYPVTRTLPILNRFSTS